ncbi:MAG: hypothetical protein O3B00_07340 [archaeon]|jgi:hypothetical protein|nr:hypothetical protein [archaeon]MDA1131297.1 hypothetical protein [archaeon]
MAMTKKQAAQRILDSFETESRRKNRTIISLVPALATSAVIAMYYSYQVAIGCILLFLALIQYGHERMGKSIEESKAASIASLGWKMEDLDDDNLVEKLNTIIEK